MMGRVVQFPVKLCFAVTVNKAQGQSLKVAGVDLRNGCFSHGQLYVACSRVFTTPMSGLLLKKQLAELNKNPVEGFSAGLIDDEDIYRWEVLIMGPPDTLYEGGFFKAHLIFPKEYPLRPPQMKFVSEIWHPNINTNGEVCISILHEPGDDKWGYEQASERWLPIHTVETILLSVISMLADPNDESPANVDAAKELRENYTDFKRKVAKCVRKSQEEFS